MAFKQSLSVFNQSLPVFSAVPHDPPYSNYTYVRRCLYIRDLVIWYLVSVTCNLAYKKSIMNRVQQSILYCLGSDDGRTLYHTLPPNKRLAVLEGFLNTIPPSPQRDKLMTISTAREVVQFSNILFPHERQQQQCLQILHYQEIGTDRDTMMKEIVASAPLPALRKIILTALHEISPIEYRELPITDDVREEVSCVICFLYNTSSNYHSLPSL
jgi:hypothetical protein